MAEVQGSQGKARQGIQNENMSGQWHRDTGAKRVGICSFLPSTSFLFFLFYLWA